MDILEQHAEDDLLAAQKAFGNKNPSTKEDSAAAQEASDSKEISIKKLLAGPDTVTKKFLNQLRHKTAMESSDQKRMPLLRTLMRVVAGMSTERQKRAVPGLIKKCFQVAHKEGTKWVQEPRVPEEEAPMVQGRRARELEVARGLMLIGGKSCAAPDVEPIFDLISSNPLGKVKLLEAAILTAADAVLIWPETATPARIAVIQGIQDSATNERIEKAAFDYLTLAESAEDLPARCNALQHARNTMGPKRIEKLIAPAV